MKTTATTNRLKAVMWVLILPLAFGLVGMASCSKRDGGAAIIDDVIVGTWQLEDFTWETTSTIAGEGTIIMAAHGKDMEGVQITFHADGTTSYSGDTFTVVYTMTMNGVTTTVNEIPTKPMVQEGTWKKNGSTLIVDHPDNPLEPQEIAIASLTQTDLHLGATMAAPVPVPGMGDITIDMHYTRVE